MVDIADVPVIDFLLVVVFDLHHLIAGSESPAEALHLALAGGVSRLDAERTAQAARILSRSRFVSPVLEGGLAAEYWGKLADA